MSAVIGIDPGVFGAIAILDGATLAAVYDMPVAIVGKTRKRHDVLAVLAGEAGDHADLREPALALDFRGADAGRRRGAGVGLVLARGGSARKRTWGYA